MKTIKLYLALALCLVGASANAQNVQLHYDFGHSIYSQEESGRQNVTLTYEQFKADALGSWFYFVDLDATKEGFSAAYTEISREFNVGKNGFAAHVEYDGGLFRGGNIQGAGLIGAAWNGHNADFSTTYSVQAMYKQFFEQSGVKGYGSWQITGVWSTALADGKVTFSGFADLWSEKKMDGKRKLVFLAEPQLWYNICPSVSVGTEVEVSNNFVFNAANTKTFFVNPTLAVKFNL